MALAVAACVAVAGGAAIGGPTRSVTSGPPTDGSAPAPNVVLFLIDDLGYSDTGITRADHRNRRGSTPTLDRLAGEGVVLTRATAQPNCSPSRASLLTGLQGSDANNQIYSVNGLNFGHRNSLLRGVHQGQPDQAAGDEALPEAAQTLAETLKNDGYATAAFGKFHVAHTRDQVVRWHGFDASYGSASGGHPGRYTASWRGAFHPMIEGGLDQFGAPYTQGYVDEHIRPFSTGVPDATLNAVVGTRKNVQDAMADATDEFIGQQSGPDGDPFFLHIGSFAVHAPINAAQGRTDLVSKYRAEQPAPQAQKVRRAYDAVLEGADQTVARLVHTLETTPDPRNGGRPMAENTIVFFTSDNGGAPLFGADNRPFRGGKSTPLEGGVRVPWLVWSANEELVPRGGWRTQPINTTDFYPTVVEAAGAQSHTPVDGVSWWPAVRDPGYDLLAGRSLPRHARVLHIPGYMSKDGSSPVTTVRDGRWKATYFYERGTWTLYDVLNDPRERRDESRRRPWVLRRLAHAAVAWAQVHRPPLATVKARRTLLVRKDFTGAMYFNGRVRHLRHARVSVKQGQQAPLLAPASFVRRQRGYVVRR